MKCKIVNDTDNEKTSIHCPYCDQDVMEIENYFKHGWFYCSKCKINVICSGQFFNPDIIYIQFRLRDYAVEICLEENFTTIFTPQWRKLFVVDHIQPGINPQNAQEWLDRILKLKAFI